MNTECALGDKTVRVSEGAKAHARASLMQQMSAAYKAEPRTIMVAALLVTTYSIVWARSLNLLTELSDNMELIFYLPVIPTGGLSMVFEGPLTWYPSHPTLTCNIVISAASLIGVACAVIFSRRISKRRACLWVIYVLAIFTALLSSALLAYSLAWLKYT